MAQAIEERIKMKSDLGGEVIIRAHCEGITPLLMHAMTAETVQQVLIEGQRPPKKTDLSPRDRCEEEKCFYEDDEGHFGIPAENLFAAMKHAGRFLKMGPVKISTASTTLLPSFLSIEEAFLPFGKDEQEWEPDVRRGVMRAGSKETAVGITRPKFPKWSFDVSFRVTLGEGVAESTIKKLLEFAGRKAGLCSFRPSCGGSFGQFKVTSFKVEKQ